MGIEDFAVGELYSRGLAPSHYRMIGPSVGSVIWAALTVDIETLLSFA